MLQLYIELQYCKLAPPFVHVVVLQVDETQPILPSRAGMSSAGPVGPLPCRFLMYLCFRHTRYKWMIHYAELYWLFNLSRMCWSRENTENLQDSSQLRLTLDTPAKKLYFSKVLIFHQVPFCNVLPSFRPNLIIQDNLNILMKNLV